MGNSKHQRWAKVALVLAVLVVTVGTVHAQEAQPVVRAVLFYSPTCPHCEAFIENDLPPLYEHYGEQLQIIGVNTLESDGWAMYQQAAERFASPEERRGVPTLIVDDTVLVGGLEINTQLPPIIDAGLAAGGIALPDLPSLRAALQTEADAQGEPNVTIDTPLPASLSPLELFARDPAGNTLAVVVLLAMLGALVYVLVLARQAFRQGSAQPLWSEKEWLVPVLAVAGLAVASYLSYVETQNIAAICGPVGDCNTVQQSPYARLFGVLPVGMLGAAGYLIILALWGWRRVSRDNNRVALTGLALLGVVTAATLFSVYLTFLEPFVIGATCAWCLTSAIIVTALLLVTARLGIGAGQALFQRAAYRQPNASET